MKTTARLGLLALLLSIVWAACTHEPDVPPRPAPKPDTTAVDSALLGKWYLAGLGRVGDTTVTPIDSVSYALEIWREGFLYGHYVNGSYTWAGDTIHIKLNAEDEKRMPEQIRRYREALLSVTSYRVDNEHQMRPALPALQGSAYDTTAQPGYCSASPAHHVDLPRLCADQGRKEDPSPEYRDRPTPLQRRYHLGDPTLKWTAHGLLPHRWSVNALHHHTSVAEN